MIMSECRFIREVFTYGRALNQRRGRGIIKLNYLVKSSVFFKECLHSFSGAFCLQFAGIVFDILYFQGYLHYPVTSF
jgi:hypothetical protein